MYENNRNLYKLVRNLFIWGSNKWLVFFMAFFANLNSNKVFPQIGDGFGGLLTISDLRVRISKPDVV